MPEQRFNEWQKWIIVILLVIIVILPPIAVGFIAQIGFSNTPSGTPPAIPAVLITVMVEGFTFLIGWGIKMYLDNSL